MVNVSLQEGMILPELKELVLSSSRSHEEHITVLYRCQLSLLEEVQIGQKVREAGRLQVQRDLEVNLLQLGFRLGYTTACCCRLFLVDLDVVLVLFDFSVAFNSIDHVLFQLKEMYIFLMILIFPPGLVPVSEGRNLVLGICFEGGLDSTISLVLYNIYMKHLGMSYVLLSCSFQVMLSRCFLTAQRPCGFGQESPLSD